MAFRYQRPTAAAAASKQGTTTEPVGRTAPQGSKTNGLVKSSNNPSAGSLSYNDIVVKLWLDEFIPFD
jgi:hypothetical protein